jgi:hypothetical protein
LLTNHGTEVAVERYAARDPATVGRARLRVVVAEIRIAGIALTIAVCRAGSEETSRP